MIFGLFVLTLILSAAYALLLLILHFKRQNSPPVKMDNPSKIQGISIVIPVRNEAKNIKTLLMMLNHQSLSKHKFEIIVVDDHSDDTTPHIAGSMGISNFTLLTLKHDFGKKAAIRAGVESAHFDRILTLDADIRISENFLETWMKTSENFGLLSGPVRVERTSTLLNHLQMLDVAGMQAMTEAWFALRKPVSCNGANLFFLRKAYLENQNIAGDTKFASGDDIFLLQSLEKQGKFKTGYANHPDLIATVEAEPNWMDFIRQRIRWISKSSAYSFRYVQILLVSIYLFNLCLLLAAFALFYDSTYGALLLAAYLLKIIVEGIFIWPVLRLFNQQKAMLWFVVVQPIHILYTVFIGVFGIFIPVQWKGRPIRSI